MVTNGRGPLLRPDLKYLCYYLAISRLLRSRKLIEAKLSTVGGLKGIMIYQDCQKQSIENIRVV